MFNVVTATYNRKHTLERVYNSLLNQSYKDFVWIIVDDCSTDNTYELIKDWMKQSKMSIEYHKLTTNQGKPKAVNFGLEKCTRDYTIIVDSDDSFVSNTFEDHKNTWTSIGARENNIAAVWTLVYDDDGNIKGDKFPEDEWEVSFQQRVLNQKKQLKGDKWHSWKTEILKQHPLYSQPNCHIGESHTWNEINKKHDFLCLNIPHLTAHYSEMSLINSKKSKKRLATGYYYSSYYGLKEVSTSEIIKHKYYHNLAFEYVKSRFIFSDKKLKLSTGKYVLSLLIFLGLLPLRLLNKVS
ncbi:glycosyltransferase family 2 protein [Psychroserpens burtonensis]|uniref:Glycosyltransferase family 2 protein n=1 Tax=Psychroserpens burtonensis TaxID=49278 RepID=A0A5C7BBR4_9FLAO|nr:glycosyltransferase family A protein [Psychroserpens burtonensis]TXE20247.1 glycosyltransferase family 2 protein [Psychroserpens burtonensis]